MLLFIFFLCLFLRSHSGELSKDDPEYEYYSHYNPLMIISAQQTKSFIINSFKIPHISCRTSYCNPSMTPWYFTKIGSDDNSKSPPFFVTWSNDDKRWGNYYMIIQFDKDGNNLIVLKNPDTFEIFDDSTGAGRRPFNCEAARDMRIYSIPHSATHDSSHDNHRQYRIAYWSNSPTRMMEQRFTNVYYSQSMDALYVLQPFTKIDGEHEFGHKHEKNWSPFLHLNNVSGAYDNLFVYSIFPHRIVHPSKSAHNITQGYTKLLVAKAHVVATSTEPNKLFQNSWEKKFGEIHGGSPAVLVDTQYGPRYLTFFHSNRQGYMVRIVHILLLYHLNE